MWAVLDPVMGVIITETRGSFAVETRIWAPRLAIEMMLDAGLEPCVLALLWYWDADVELCWDAGFEPRVLAMQWCWDASFEPCVLASQWCWDAGFEPCVLASQWCWDASFEPRVLTLCQRFLSAMSSASDNLSSVIFRQYTGTRLSSNTLDEH